MKYSEFGKRFARKTGALSLMEDIGTAFERGDSVYMLGGGNPARIPEMDEVFAAEMAAVMSDPHELHRMASNYAAPAGEQRFRAMLAKSFKNRYGWNITADNIALTSGSQNSFFMLFNLLAGKMTDGAHKRILLPITPEYMGYEDVGVVEGLFTSRRPKIEILDDNLFKYHPDFSALDVGPDIAAICVSRPTNPTGNVLTDNEVAHLSELARGAGVPMIVDNAYGAPFPLIINSEVTPFWDENTILCMSLSKIGLPAVRTGIVVASEETIFALSAMNAIMHLAVSSVGPVWVYRAIESGRLYELSRNVIQPFYDRSAQNALGYIRESFKGLEYHVHAPEGAIFLWLWFPGLPITSEELYERLKQRGVFVLSGHHFFPGLDEDWRHVHECIRINHGKDDRTVREGIQIIAETVKEALA
jgi:valine--pyruvate aminotransferase